MHVIVCQVVRVEQVGHLVECHLVLIRDYSAKLESELRGVGQYDRL